MNPLSSLFDLTGKIAIVTGASRGIGQTIAEVYASAGAKVILASRKQDELDKVVEKIRSAGGEVMAIAAHTGKIEDIERLVGKAIDKYGGIDILVNNAATNPHFGPVMTSKDSQWDKIWEVNVKGYFKMAKACMKSMEQRGGGKIINLASIAGKIPQPFMGVYCISKAAVIMLTEVLAVELAPQNIQVNAIAPGFIKTSFSSAIWSSPDIHKMVTDLIPQKRIAEPKELVGIALYLASEASSFTTGSTILVDGGQRIGYPLSF